MELPLIPQDKANHIIYGAAIYLAALALCNYFVVPYPHDTVAAAAVVAAALGREIYGYITTKRFDPVDIAATLLGGGAIYLARELP